MKITNETPTAELLFWGWCLLCGVLGLACVGGMVVGTLAYLLR